MAKMAMPNADMPHKNHQYSSDVDIYTSSSQCIDVDYVATYTGGRCRYDAVSSDTMVLQTCDVKYSKPISKKIDHFRSRVNKRKKKSTHYRYYATLLCYALLLPFTGVSLATWTVNDIVPVMQKIPILTSATTNSNAEHLNYHFVDANNIAVKAAKTHHLSASAKRTLINDIHWIQNNQTEWTKRHPNERYSIGTPLGQMSEGRYLASVEHSAGLPYTKQARSAVRRLRQKNTEFRTLQYSSTRITLVALFMVLGLQLASFFTGSSLKRMKKTTDEDGTHILD